MPEHFDERQLIFYAAIPGSGWSKLSLLLGCCANLNLNKSDRNPEREEIGKNGNTGLVHHKGAYWDPGMEFGQGFDDIARNYSKESFIEECLRGFTEHNDQNYLIRSHFFCEYKNLQWLTENFPNNRIIVVLRSVELSIQGWNEGMTFTNNYPNYQAWMRYPDEVHPENKEHFEGMLWKHDRMVRRWILENDDVIDIIQPNKKFINKLGYVWDDEGCEEYEKLVMVHQFFKSEVPMYDAPFAFYNCQDLW